MLIHIFVVGSLLKIFDDAPPLELLQEGTLSQFPSTTHHPSCNSTRPIPAPNMLTRLLTTSDRGWSKPPPLWVQDLCPQVIQHYQRFPHSRDRIVYEYHPKKKNDTTSSPTTIELPFLNTFDWARGVCTLHIAQQFVQDRAGITLLLFAGSHVGALFHGQPVPWDDDLDVLVSLSDYAQLIRLFLKFTQSTGCHRIHDTAKLCAKLNYNAIKLWVLYSGDEADNEGQPTNRWWAAPFLDVFPYAVQNNRVYEALGLEDAKASLLGKWKPSANASSYALREFFPLDVYYFAGMTIYGPNERSSKKRYRVNQHQCYTMGYNHRLDRYFGTDLLEQFQSLELNCCEIARHFPFRFTNSSAATITNGQSSLVLATHDLVNQSLVTALSARCDSRHAPQAAFCNRCSPLNKASCHGQGDCQWDKDQSLCVDTNPKNHSAVPVSSLPLILRRTFCGREGSLLVRTEDLAMSCERCGYHPVKCQGECEWDEQRSKCVSRFQ